MSTNQLNPARVLSSSCFLLRTTTKICIILYLFIQIDSSIGMLMVNLTISVMLVPSHYRQWSVLICRKMIFKIQCDCDNVIEVWVRVITGYESTSDAGYHLLCPRSFLLSSLQSDLHPSHTDRPHASDQWEASIVSKWPIRNLSSDSPLAAHLHQGGLPSEDESGHSSGVRSR